jgi:RecB family exonuclease
LEWLYNQVKQGRQVEMHKLIVNFAENWQKNLSPNTKIKSDETAEQYFNKGIKFLADYYLKHEPFVDNTLYIEKKIIFPLDEEHKIQGYIDRLVLNENGEYEIHDYKTNANMKKQEDVDADRQLALYHLGLQEMLGKNISVKLIWHMLAHNKTITSRRTQEQLENLKQETLALIKKIETTTEWPACDKPWCDWCSYKKENNLFK